MAGHAAVQDGQRGGANIFRKLEIFVEAQAERLKIIRRGPVIELVVPTIDDGLTLGNVADRGFPAVSKSMGISSSDCGTPCPARDVRDFHKRTDLS